MITASRDAIYTQALQGEPLASLVASPSLTMHRGWIIVGQWPIAMPQSVGRDQPESQRMVSEIRRWTGWSSRFLADLLRTSHTTVLNIESGRPLVAGHSGVLGERLADAHDVVTRVFLLSDRDPDRTSRVLGEAGPGGMSPIQQLRAGEPGRAYLAAIDVLRPRPTGLLVGSRPKRGGATAPLDDIG
jgi:hypothetical protein